MTARTESGVTERARQDASTKTLWIAWEDDSSIRSPVLARELGSTYRAFTDFDRSRVFGWLRYPVATVRTISAILRLKPRWVIVQNPSIFLAFQAALLKPLLGFQLVIDLHTPFARSPRLKTMIADFLHGYGLRHCDLVIVSNEAYRARVEQQTRQPVLVLPDKIPQLHGRQNRDSLRGRRCILYICTFSVDEPWREVLAAAALLPHDTSIYISGRSPLTREDVPANVILTGFLPTEAYQDLLRSVDAVMVLTTAEENLVCGGYEAVAAGKPLILSDTGALRSYFNRGTVFTKNSPAAIAESITRAVDRVAELTPEIEALREQLTRGWEERWRAILSKLELAPPQDGKPDPATSSATHRLRVGG